MAPSFWGRETRGGGGMGNGGGTPVVVKMENPNWSISEVDSEMEPGSPAGLAAGKAGRGKNARQITWVLLPAPRRSCRRRSPTTARTPGCPSARCRCYRQ